MTVRKSIIISKEIDKRVKEECKRLAVSQSNLISFALDDYFRKISSNMADKEAPSTFGALGGPR